MCSQLNCGIRSESGVCCRIMFSAVNQVFAVEFVWSAANQVFAARIAMFIANQVCTAKFYIPQRFRFLLQTFVDRRDSGFSSPNLCGAQWNCVVRSESGVRSRMCCTQRNRFPLLNLCGLQRIRCLLSNCVVHSESGFRCPIYVVRSESRVRCPNYAVHSKSGFYFWILLTATIQVFVAKFCWPQQFRFSLPKFMCWAAKLCCP